jgi:hypothetical protein
MRYGAILIYTSLSNGTYWLHIQKTDLRYELAVEARRVYLAKATLRRSIIDEDWKVIYGSEYNRFTALQNSLKPLSQNLMLPQGL